MAICLKKVLISDEIEQECIDILKQNGIDAVKNTKLTKEQLLQEIPQYDGLIVRSATKVTAELINAATNLKIVGRAGTGVDNIDIPAATKKGVIVMNTPGGNTMSAAELTCTMVLTSSRHVSQGTESLKAGRWDRKKFMGNEVYGKTLAIIGLGRIGKEVALRMQSFGMTTIGFDPIIPASVSAEFNTEWMTLEDLWPKADYITVHTPLIPQTKNLINAEVFSKCKKGVRIINCARGGIVDESALLDALNNGQCGGAGLDVFVEEPPKDLSLVNHPLVTSCPHLGASTVEAQGRVAKEIAEQFVDVTNGKSLFGAINAQALTNALSASTKPWVQLGKGLGRLGAALLGEVNAQTQVQLITEGPSMSKAGSYMGAASLVGLLKQLSGNGLNLVSAPAFAKEVGLQVSTEYKSDVSSDRATLVISQPGGSVYRLSGTVGGGNALLTSINDLSLSQGVVLQGNVLVYRAQDNIQTLATVTGALAGAGTTVESYVTSQAANNERWSIMSVSAALQDIACIKQSVNFVQQMAF